MTLIGTIDKLVLIWIPVLQAYWRPTKLETLGRRGRKHVYSTSCTDYYQDIVRCNVRPHVEEIQVTRKICVLALISLTPAKVFGMLLTILHR
jgi:hypothetical protein